MTTAQDIANACRQRAGHEPVSEELIEGRLKIWPGVKGKYTRR